MVGKIEHVDLRGSPWIAVGGLEWLVIALRVSR